MGNFSPLAGQVRLAQSQMPGWSPSGAPAFMYASDQGPATTAPLPSAPAAAPAPAPEPAPQKTGATVLALGVGALALSLLVGWVTLD